jgi:hypothetical protein
MPVLDQLLLDSSKVQVAQTHLEGAGLCLVREPVDLRQPLRSKSDATLLTPLSKKQGNALAREGVADQRSPNVDLQHLVALLMSVQGWQRVARWEAHQLLSIFKTDRLPPASAPHPVIVTILVRRAPV